MPASHAETILGSLKRVAAVLNEADLPFVPADGLATRAGGGPPTEEDIGLLIRAADTERAHTALARRTAHRPFALAYFALVEELGICPRPGQPAAGHALVASLPVQPAAAFG